MLAFISSSSVGSSSILLLTLHLTFVLVHQSSDGFGGSIDPIFGSY